MSTCVLPTRALATRVLPRRALLSRAQPSSILPSSVLPTGILATSTLATSTLATRALPIPVLPSRATPPRRGQDIPNLIVRGLGVHVVIEQRSGTRSREHRRDPRVRVTGAPDGDADTALHGQTRAHDVAVVVRLLLQRAGVGRQAAVAHVDLCVGHVDALGHELVQHRGQLVAGPGLADDEVALQADAVDAGAALLDDVDDLERLLLLVPGLLDVVVIIVELGVRVGGGRRLEGDGQVVGAQDAEEDRVAEAAAVLERLVDHVPGVALALEVAGDVADVRVDDAREGVAVPVARLDYTLGQLKEYKTGPAVGGTEHGRKKKTYPMTEAGCARPMCDSVLSAARSTWQS